MTNQIQAATAVPSIGELHEVRGFFAGSDEMNAAIEQLTMAGFDRADVAIPEISPPPERATPESGALDPDTDEDARQARTMHTSTAAAAAALAGAGLTVATGGAAAAALGAAVAAGAVVGGATFGISSAANDQDQAERDVRASLGRLVLSVRTASPEKRAAAETILRDTGATKIEAV